MLTKERSIGPGGAPDRADSLPTDAAKRKEYPMGTGLLDYFPDALVAVSNVSFVGDRQHNPGKQPGEPPHWTRSKSTDQFDTAIRHLAQRGGLDTDGVRHTAKAAWRILAMLQIEIEEEMNKATEAPAGGPVVA